MNARPAPAPHDWRDAATLLALAVFAALLRFPGLESLPPALWFDEGLNGCDTLRIVRGGPWRIVFPEVFPREPLLIYLMVPLVKLFGTEVFCIRLPAALIGTMAPLFTYAWLREASTRRVALFGSFFLAGLRWHVHFSRFGERTIYTPTLAACFLWLAWRAFRTASGRWALAAGAVFALGFYTYLSWHFFALVAVGVMAAGSWTAPRHARGRVALGLVLGATAVILPLALHYISHPQDLTARPAALSLFGEGWGRAWAELWKNARDASLMLFWRGDHVDKHNIPWRPALEPIGAAFFFGGFIRAIATFRHERLSRTLAAWLIVGTLPTVVSRTDSANFLRTLILTPCVSAFVALGADGLSSALERGANTRRLAWAAPALALGVSVILMMTAYFIVWPKVPGLWIHYSGQPVQIARFVRDLNRGETAYVPGFIHDNPSFRYLTGESPRIHSFSYVEAFGPGPAPDADHLIVESGMIDPLLRPILASRLPGAVHLFDFPVEGVAEEGMAGHWASAWRLPAGRRLGQEEAAALDKDIARAQGALPPP